MKIFRYYKNKFALLFALAAIADFIFLAAYSVYGWKSVSPQAYQGVEIILSYTLSTLSNMTISLYLFAISIIIEYLFRIGLLLQSSKKLKGEKLHFIDNGKSDTGKK